MTDEGLPEVGAWARDKLDRLRRYLAAYTAIMAKQKWAEGFLYVDAFAGAGRARVRQDEDELEEDPNEILDLGASNEDDQDQELTDVLDGSPAVALGVDPPFTRYVFLERKRRRAANLECLQAEHPERTIDIHIGDSNLYLRDTLLKRFDWKSWRAVVFVDPFGMNVPWDTFTRLAKTKAIEVFVNFPLNMAIQRLLKRSGTFSEKERKKLDDYFGDPGWHDLLYKETRDLFGASAPKKVEDSSKQLVNWYRARLKAAFGYSSTAHLVSSTRNRPLYYLIHAGPNATGAKIASHVLSAGRSIAGRSIGPRPRR
jgi:three-Cys-motif partner protein